MISCQNTKLPTGSMADSGKYPCFQSRILQGCTLYGPPVTLLPSLRCACICIITIETIEPVGNSSHSY